MKKLRIAIITFHNALNCGALLQAWALQTVLERMGHSVIFPDCNAIGAYPGYFGKFSPDKSSVLAWFKYSLWYILVGLLSICTDWLKNLRFSRFKKRHLNLCKVNQENIADVAELAIFGSDQIWNEELIVGYSGLFFGRTLPQSFPKIAYGISLGDGQMSARHSKDIRVAAADFMSVSFREPTNDQRILDCKARNAAVVIDPTLFLDKKDYVRVSCSLRIKSDAYVLFFSLRGDAKIEHVARSVAKLFGVDIVVVNMAQKGLWRCRRCTHIAVSPDLLLSYLRNAEYVLTDSFHGVALSIVFGKRFVVFGDGAQTRSGRIFNLLNSLGSSCRLLPNESDAEVIVKLLVSQVPSDTSEKLMGYRKASLLWLKSAIDEI